MLEISTTTVDMDATVTEPPNVPEQSAAAVPQAMRFNLAEIPPSLVPNTTADLQRMAQEPDMVALREQVLQDPSLLPTIFSHKPFLELLSECSQHPIMIWYHLSQPVGQSLLSILETFLHNHPTAAPSRPAAPFIGPILAIFGVLVTVVTGFMQFLGSMSAEMAKAEAQEGGSGQATVLEEMWNMFRADKGPPGVRAGFAGPELYDARGPYGPEPFPFQTPGAEKCHRFLTSYVWKCAVV
eukprot:c8368_g1_i1.p1 GENE.c8368_g1_i1~~c8368_g1_i1.p1  ORF type:complete len:240 (+),score=57.46 c8368_g1_i1:397-1116(+)